MQKRSLQFLYQDIHKRLGAYGGGGHYATATPQKENFCKYVENQITFLLY